MQVRKPPLTVKRKGQLVSFEIGVLALMGFGIRRPVNVKRQARNLISWQSVWPCLRAMENAKDTNGCFCNGIRRNVRGAVDYQFTRTNNSADTATCGKFDEPAGGGHDPFVDQDSR